MTSLQEHSSERPLQRPTGSRPNFKLISAAWHTDMTVTRRIATPAPSQSTLSYISVSHWKWQISFSHRGGVRLLENKMFSIWARPQSCPALRPWREIHHVRLNPFWRRFIIFNSLSLFFSLVQLIARVYFSSYYVFMWFLWEGFFVLKSGRQGDGLLKNGVFFF